MGPEAEEGECPWIQGRCGEVGTETSWGYGVGEEGLSRQEAFCTGHRWGFTIDFCSPQCYAEQRFVVLSLLSLVLTKKRVEGMSFFSRCSESWTFRTLSFIFLMQSNRITYLCVYLVYALTFPGSGADENVKELNYEK